MVQRLAVVPSPPLLVAATLAACLGGFVVTRSLTHATAQTHADDPDLDGDGIADRFDGVFESCGTGGCAYEVYLRRPGGGDQYVGRMEGYWPFQIERLRTDEPADVIAVWRLGATESIGTRYRFARGAYRRFSESTCYREACTAEHIVHR